MLQALSNYTLFTLNLERGGVFVQFVCLGTQLLGLLLSTNPLVSAIRSEEVVPPAEAGRVAAKEGHVVVVVVIRTRPERNPVVQTDGEVVARVGVHSLEQTQDHPNVHGKDMQVFGEGAEKEGSTDGAHTQDQHLQRVCVLCRETERRDILVVQFMNVLVEGTEVHGTVGPVVECVFEHEKEGNLPDHLGPARERHFVCRHTKVFADRVETPNLGQFHGKVAEEHKARAAPLVGEGRYVVGLQLVLAHRRHGVNDHPWNGAAEVHDLVQEEAHHSCGNHGVTPVLVPLHPQLLGVGEFRGIEISIEDMRRSRMSCETFQCLVERLRQRLHDNE